MSVYICAHGWFDLKLCLFSPAFRIPQSPEPDLMLPLPSPANHRGLCVIVTAANEHVGTAERLRGCGCDYVRRGWQQTGRARLTCTACSISDIVFFFKYYLCKMKILS